MPAALISFSLDESSLTTSWSISAGVIGIGSTASCFNLAFIAGVARTFTAAAWNLSTMARGVFAGMNTPYQTTVSALAKPASAGVGTSGRSDARVGVDT